uniref:Uncharacterized protein n=1 Tax=Ciona savignyi TaxID=51511 RepID=H2Y634_CIOSA
MLQLNSRNVAKSRYIIKLLRSKRRCDERFRKVHRSSSISGLRNQAMTTNHLTDHDVFASTSINELFSPQNQPEQNEINEYMGISPNREEPKKTTYTSKFVREMSTNPKFLFNFVQTCFHVGLPSDAISTVITKLDQSAPSVDHKLLTYMMRWIADLPPSNQLPLHNDITSPLSMNLILFEKIRESGLQPSAASCACVLASLQKFQCNNKHLVKKMTTKFCEAYTFDELLDGCTVGGDTYKFCHLAIQTLSSTFQHSPKPPLD